MEQRCRTPDRSSGREHIQRRAQRSRHRTTQDLPILMLRLLVVLTGLGLASCKPQPVEVASAAGGVQPFAALHGVHLGMTARELARARPAARPEGYSGYVETVRGHPVIYSIPGSYSEDQPVSPRARVRSVSSARSVAGMEQGMSDWHHIVRVASSGFTSNPVCSRMDTRSGTVGVEAAWTSQGSIFTAGLYESRASRGTPYSVGIVIRVATQPDALHLRSPIDCDVDLRRILRTGE